MRFIGLVGAKGSGKDTVGNMICELDPSFRRVAFGDVLKSVALATDPIVAITKADEEFFSILDYKNSGLIGVDRDRSITFVRLSMLVYTDRIGWDGAKKIADVRRLLQRLGTEGGRNNIDDNVWVTATWDKYVYPYDFFHYNNSPEPNFVFTDVRFPNEIAAIRSQRYGEIWRIERESVEDGDPHPSERAWREEIPDKTIANHDRSLAELKGIVCHLLGEGRDPD